MSDTKSVNGHKHSEQGPDNGSGGIMGRVTELAETNGELRCLLLGDPTSHVLLRSEAKPTREKLDRAMAFTMRRCGFTLDEVREQILSWDRGTGQKRQGDDRYFAKLYGLDAEAGGVVANPGSIIPSWSDLDMTVLRQGRREPPRLPIEVFSPCWDKWVHSAAENAGCPIDYVAIPLLAAAAMVLGNARWVMGGPDWIECPVLWCGVVGDPSSNKSPGADPVMQAVRKLEQELATGFDATNRRYLSDLQVAKVRREAWEAEVKQAIKAEIPPPDMPRDAIEPIKPVMPRIIAQDSTPEKIGELLSVHEKGLLYFRDELAGWFGSFDKYGGSGSERAMWIEATGGRPHTIDRVKHPQPIKVPRLTVGVFGGVQPERLATMLGGVDDGLTARFLWAWPNRAPLTRPTSTPDRALVLDALRRLLYLPMVPQDEGPDAPLMIKLSPEADETFWNWRVEQRKAEDNAFGVEKSALGKTPGQLLRLALVLEHLWWAAPKPNDKGKPVWKEAPPPKVISERAILAGACLINSYFIPMAARVYGDAVLPEADRNAAKLARFILREELRRVNTRDLRRKARLNNMRETAKVQAAVKVLVEAGWLRPDPERENGTAGRMRDDYEVNPALWDMAHE